MVRFQGTGRAGAARPPYKTTLRQPFLCEPKSLTVISKRPDRRGPAAPKEKQAAGKGIGLELFPAQPNQPVDPFPSVNGVESDEDAHVRRDLQHSLVTQKRANQMR